MKAPINKALGGMPPKFTAGFDSGTGFVKALSNCLKGQDFEGVGITPPLKTLATIADRLPRKMREMIYVRTTGAEEFPAEELKDIEAEEFSKAVVNMYPQRKYPAIMVGSVSGAMVHLAALMGIPLLPQSFLIPVRRPFHLPIDEPKRTMDWALKPGEDFLQNNPGMKLHHMYDPGQDRLTLEKITYFRVKMQRMHLVYERFINNHLQEGGTIIISDCTRTWPVTTVNDRFIFQVGGLGGITEEEYLHGSERVSQFLEKYNSHVRKWDTPEADSKQPEAEWGFDRTLMKDLERISRQNGFNLKNISFFEPEHPSPFVAELYRWWYGKKGALTNRLIGENFFLHDPYWTLRTASVPFWMRFNMDPSADWLEKYLEEAAPYDEIYQMLFSHGVEGPGLAEAEKWEKIISRARVKHDFLGVNPQNFPLDLASMINYNKDFKKRITSRYDFKVPLSLDQLEEFYGKYDQQEFKDLLQIK